ncbi:MAG: HAD-IA family hydrolase [Acidobacteriota bacterium]|nr:HAD-IA family hydrolase [Acidobacteriota bacterium]
MPAVIFDFDGLMIDSESEVAACILDVLADRGIVVEMSDVGHLFGSTDVAAEWDRWLASLGPHSLTFLQLEQAVNAVLPDRLRRLPLLPGVAEVLDAAHAARWQTAIATGQRRPALDEHLARLGLTGQFDEIVTRAEVEHGKPAPDIFLEAADRLGSIPADCLVLEDSLPGCLAALAAGMRVTVCPSRVSAGCAFPAEAARVASLTEVHLVPTRG